MGWSDDDWSEHAGSLEKEIEKRDRVLMDAAEVVALMLCRTSVELDGKRYDDSAQIGGDAFREGKRVLRRIARYIGKPAQPDGAKEEAK